MVLTVLSGFFISFAINACFAEGSCCMILSTAISSKVQSMHFGGSESAEFSLWANLFALREPLFALCSSVAIFQSKCICQQPFASHRFYGFV